MTESERPRSTRVERLARLDQVEAWLAQRRSRSEILKLIEKEWAVSERHADRYISEASRQWSTRAEPARLESRSRNLATCDVGIADAFRSGKLRDVAALLRLRAALDGSLAATTEIPVATPESATEQNPGVLVETLSSSLMPVLWCSESTPQLRQGVVRLIDELSAYLNTTPASPG